MYFIIIYLFTGVIAGLIGPLASELKEIMNHIKTPFHVDDDGIRKHPPARNRIVAMFFVWVIVIILYPLYYLSELKDFFSSKRKKHEPKLDEGLLYFSKMSGTGDLFCKDCHFNTCITGFMHGPLYYYVKEGFQCQKCGQLQVIENVSNNKKDVTCECSGILSCDDPIFCPNCKSANVKYYRKVIT